MNVAGVNVRIEPVGGGRVRLTVGHGVAAQSETLDRVEIAALIRLLKACAADA